MRVVGAILSRLKQARRDDPIFGSMLYMGDGLRYWEGKAAFTPTASTIEVFVDGSADDSMEQQHNFFRRILQEWPTLSETVGRFLREQWHERESGIRVESPWAWFRILSLSIPNADIDDATWELSFVTPSDPNQLWTVDMKGLLPERLIVDG